MTSKPKKELRIYVEQFPNKDLRELHLSLPTARAPFSKYDAKGVPKCVARLERRFKSEISFARSFSEMVDHKSIRIERNKAFSWAHSIDAAVRILERHFNANATVEIQEREPWMDKLSTEDFDQ